MTHIVKPNALPVQAVAPTCGTLLEAKRHFKAGAYATQWAETRRNKIAGSVNKAARVYASCGRTPFEDEIACDPAEPKRIHDEIKKAGRLPAGCPLKTIKSVKRWAGNVSSFFDVFSGQRARRTGLMTQQVDWSALIDHIVGRTGGPVILGTRERIPVNVLSRECRLAGLSLRFPTAGELERIAPALPTKVVAAIRRGTARLDTLRSDDRVPHRLLPLSPIGKVDLAATPDHRVTPPMCPELQSLLGDYLDMRLGSVTRPNSRVRHRPRQRSGSSMRRSGSASPGAASSSGAVASCSACAAALPGRRPGR